MNDRSASSPLKPSSHSESAVVVAAVAARLLRRAGILAYVQSAAPRVGRGGSRRARARARARKRVAQDGVSWTHDGPSAHARARLACRWTDRSMARARSRAAARRRRREQPRARGGREPIGARLPAPRAAGGGAAGAAAAAAAAHTERMHAPIAPLPLIRRPGRPRSPQLRLALPLSAPAAFAAPRPRPRPPAVRRDLGGARARTPAPTPWQEASAAARPPNRRQIVVGMAAAGGARASGGRRARARSLARARSHARRAPAFAAPSPPPLVGAWIKNPYRSGIPAPPAKIVRPAAKPRIHLLPRRAAGRAVVRSAGGAGRGPYASALRRRPGLTATMTRITRTSPNSYTGSTFKRTRFPPADLHRYRRHRVMVRSVGPPTRRAFRAPRSCSRNSAFDCHSVGWDGLCYKTHLAVRAALIRSRVAKRYTFGIPLRWFEPARQHIRAAPSQRNYGFGIGLESP